MLIEIRERASSWVAYIIIGLLILSFALWGIQEYFGAGGLPPVAKINDVEISQQEFNQQFQQRKQMLQSVLGAGYAEQYADETELRKQVVDGMVRSELLRQEVDDAGFRISDASLIQRIQEVPQFQKNGKFDPEQYERLLQAQRYSKAQFESQLREQDKLRQYEASIAATSFMPISELQRFQEINEQSRDFKYTLVQIDHSNVQTTEEEIEAYYNENKLNFQTPEQLNLAYVELKEEDVAKNVSVTDEDAKLIYESQPERFMSAELRKTRHMLFKVDHEIEKDALEWDEAMEKAADMIKQLQDGANFSELAKEHSQDSLSAEKGGDIGFIAPGDFTNSEIENALFSLQVGDHSKPIKTEQGVQIVMVDEINAPKLKSFSEVREKIINERKSQIAQERYIEIADEIANLLVEQPDDLDEISETFSLDTQETGWLNKKSNTGIFVYPKVKNTAFSSDIIDEALNSELIEVEDGHVIAYRLLEHRPAELKPLGTQERAQISIELAIKKASEQSFTKGQQFLNDLRNGTTLQAIAESNEMEIVSHGAIRRDDNRVPTTISNRAFTLSIPETGQVSVDGVALGDGSFALIELNEVKNGSSKIDTSKALELSQRVNYGRREFVAIIDSVKEKGDIEVFESNFVSQ